MATCDRTSLLRQRLGWYRDRLRGLRPTLRGLFWLALATGAVFRLNEYVTLRSWWKDELSLRANVLGRPLLELDRPLVQQQLAPPGYLVAVRAWSRVLGGSRWMLRLPALVCGTAALLALGMLGRRVVDPVAVPLAVGLAAVSDELIYYATEFKPYASDLLLTLACLWMGLDLAEGRLTRGRLVGSALLGGLAAWFAHPLAFVLAGIGLTLAALALMRREWKRLGMLAGMGAFWLANIAGCVLVSDGMIDRQAREFLWTWWDFAFLRLPPRSIGEAAGVFWQFANVLINPVGLQTPINPLVTALTGLGLWVVGLFALWQRGRRAAVGMLIGPIVLTMAASALGRYPFHGRVLMFLVPAFLLPIAEGVAAIGRRLGNRVLVALVVFLLIAPTGVELMRLGGDWPRVRVFDTHGDQRHDLLDYLESRSTTGR